MPRSSRNASPCAQCVHNECGLTRTRHNNILKRLERATSKEIDNIFIDQTIPGSPDILRPDLVARTQDSITIVHVMVPVETDPDAFDKARLEKTQKYADLVQWSRMKYSQVNFGVFIVGSLGTWDTNNEETLKMLRIGHRYAMLFCKLCCVDAMEGSLSIWKTRQ